MSRARERAVAGNTVRAAPSFPGTILELDASGRITEAWCGPAGPVLSPAPDALVALGSDADGPDAALVQLLLASAIGAPRDAWPVLAAGAPATLTRRDGQVLAVTWDAVTDGDAIRAVVVFAHALPAPPVEAEDLADDPAESNRICVEALAQLGECEACLLHLQRDPDARAPIHRMFRAMHTIKGAMRGRRLGASRDLAHQTESVIEALRELDESPPPLIAEIASLVHKLRAAINAARPRGEVDDAMTDLLSGCRPALVDLQLATGRLASGDASAAAAAARAIERIGAAGDRANLRALAAQCNAAARAVGALAGRAAIEPGEVDELVVLDRQLELYAAVHREASALAGGPALLAAACAQLGEADRPARAELGELIAQSRILSLVGAFADPAPLAARCTAALLADATAMFEPCPPRDDTAQSFERARRELLAAIDQLSARAPDVDLAPLRAAVDRLGLVPLAPLAHRLIGLIRSLAPELDKRCDARVELGDVLVPPATARIVGDILLHAVRNALDHGIEAAADRATAGKPATGTIEVAAYAMGDRLVVTVRDDGRGVDLDRVRRRAIERGLLSAPTAAAADPAQLLQLLFHPGFSTAASVTLLSGRGIGMDVIQSLAIERGGSVSVASIAGCGTELTIELPLPHAVTAA